MASHSQTPANTIEFLVKMLQIARDLIPRTSVASDHYRDMTYKCVQALGRVCPFPTEADLDKLRELVREQMSMENNEVEYSDVEYSEDEEDK